MSYVFQLMLTRPIEHNNTIEFLNRADPNTTDEVEAIKKCLREHINTQKLSKYTWDSPLEIETPTGLGPQRHNNDVLLNR